MKQEHEWIDTLVLRVINIFDATQIAKDLLNHGLMTWKQKCLEICPRVE